MSPASRLLDRLDGVRHQGNGQYLARCPAHQDRCPSLSVRDCGDRVLLHCHAGCEASEILSAVGLELKDLFERPAEHKEKPVPGHSRWDYRQFLRILRTECGVVLIAANDLSRGKALSNKDVARLQESVRQITRITEVAK